MSTKNKSDVKDLLNALEKSIEQCRLLYEQYFSGIEKREPLWHRQDIVRQFTALRKERLGSAIDRFRLQGIQQRFNTLNQYWNRVNLQREKGTYIKDIQRARRRMGMQKKQAAKQREGYDPMDDGADTDERPTVHSIHSMDEMGGEINLSAAAAAAAAATERSSRQSNLGETLSDARCQKIYRNYIAAKQRCGESTQGVSYDSMVNSIRKQVPKLQQRGYKEIDFKVVIRDGKAALKPVAKKDKA